MFFLGRLAEWAQKVLLPLGGWGLFAAAVLDSSFLALPGGMDLWMISLSALRPSRMPFYVIVATVGSVIGCSTLYFVARKGEAAFSEKNPKYSGLPRARRWVERHGSLALIVAALLPPPAPFKLFVIAAGLMKQSFAGFVLALLIGRSARYLLEGLLAVRYGQQAWEWLENSGPAVIGAVVVAIVLIFLARRFQRKAPPAEN